MLISRWKINHTQDNRVMCYACFPHLNKANSGLCSASDWFGHTAQHWWPWSKLAQQLGQNLSAGFTVADFSSLIATALKPTGKWSHTGLGCAQQVPIALPGHPGWSRSPGVSICPVPPGLASSQLRGPYWALQTSAFLLRLNSDLSSKGFCLVLKGKGVCLIVCLYYWIIIQRAN